MKEKIALLIGRFQPFHKGHLHAVKYILDRHSFLYIGVGSALDSHTKRNPFTFSERLEMIRLALDEAGISNDKYYVIPIPDSRYHSTWVSIVKMLIPKFDVVYSNDPLTRILMQENGYEVEHIPYFQREVYTGEEFRNRVVSNGEWEELVPRAVYNYILQNKLHERIIQLWKTDKITKK